MPSCLNSNRQPVYTVQFPYPLCLFSLFLTLTHPAHRVLTYYVYCLLSVSSGWNTRFRRTGIFAAFTGASPVSRTVPGTWSFIQCLLKEKVAQREGVLRDILGTRNHKACEIFQHVKIFVANLKVWFHFADCKPHFKIQMKSRMTSQHRPTIPNGNCAPVRPGRPSPVGRGTNPTHLPRLCYLPGSWRPAGVPPLIDLGSSWSIRVPNSRAGVPVGWVSPLPGSSIHVVSH